MQLTFLTIISGNITFGLWHLALRFMRAVGGCQAYSRNPVSAYMCEVLSYPCAAWLLSQPNAAGQDGIGSPGLPLLYQRAGDWAVLTACLWFAGCASGQDICYLCYQLASPLCLVKSRLSLPLLMAVMWYPWD